MTRLFNAGSGTAPPPAAETRRARIESQRRAAEVEQFLESQGIDATPPAALRGTAAIQPVRYESFRRPGKKWIIEHAQVGADYVYQVFAIRPPVAEWPDVVSAMIATMDAIFPRSVTITYKPPDPQFQVQYYTIRVQNVTGMPGWETACKERVLNGLVHIDVWNQADGLGSRGTDGGAGQAGMEARVDPSRSSRSGEAPVHVPPRGPRLGR